MTAAWRPFREISTPWRDRWAFGAARMLTQDSLPLARNSLLTALLIVFVDVMKELPATMILHPFNFQTLAVQAHRLAADERLAEAAVPSLALVAVSLIPVVLLCRTLAANGGLTDAPSPIRHGTALKAG